MKKSFLCFVLAFYCLQLLKAQTPTLGSYANTTTTYVGASAFISPTVPPSATSSITASTTVNFKGLLHVNPSSGIITVTNASPAGTYTIMVTAFNGAATATKSFSLAVGTNNCTLGAFDDFGINNENLSQPKHVTIGDFNADGNQDLASTSSSANNVAILLGSGLGTFTKYSTVAVGSTPYMVTVDDFNGDGKQDFATANYNSNTVSIRLGSGNGSFTGSTEISVGSRPTKIVTGDFNGDGIRDFITANEGGSTVSIRFGDGLGGFTSSSNLSIGQTPNSLVVADFNNDDKQDFATSSATGTVIVRLGDGAGGFTPVLSSSITNGISSMASGDINNDGKEDLALTVYGGMAIRLGDGAGGFSGTTIYWSGYSSTTLSLGDVNNDGRLDMLATNNQSSYALIGLGNGLGGFADPYNYFTGNQPSFIAIGDFNKDGRPDFATASIAGIIFRLGISNEIGITSNNTNIADGDTAPDLIDNTNFGNVSVGTRTVRTYAIKNTGKAPLIISAINITGADSALFTKDNITLPVTLALGQSTSFTITYNAAAIGVKNAVVNVLNNDCDEANYDFSLQGTGVIIVPVIGTYPSANVPTAGGNISINPSTPPVDAVNMIGTAPAHFKGQIRIEPITGAIKITNAHPAGTYLIKVRAFNGISSTAVSSFTLTVGNTLCSQGLFSSPNTLSVSGYASGIVVGDYNNDGNQDFISSNAQLPGSICLSLGNGSGAFNNVAQISTGIYSSQIATADFNGDGNMDVVIASGIASSVGVRLGSGTGNFTGTTNYTVSTTPGGVAVGDFNGDNKQDFAVTLSDASLVAIFIGNGQGEFNMAYTFAVTGKPVWLHVSDFNNDGIQDILTENNSNKSVSVRLGNGQGNFTGSTEMVWPNDVASVAVADFNADGNQDLAVATDDNFSSSISIRFGTGTGIFSGTSSLYASATGELISADINGDGKMDLLRTSRGANQVFMMLGDGVGNFGIETLIEMGQTPGFLAVGDFNGDGRQDVVTGATTFCVRLAAVNEINVQGNNTNILAGSPAATLANHTDFGSTSTLTRTFTIQNTGTGNLKINTITFAGADSSSFKMHSINLPAIIAPGSSQTFKILFRPTSVGNKIATVIINNDDCDEALYDFVLKGTAVSAPPTLGVYPSAVTVMAGGNASIPASTSSTNAASITATAPASFNGMLSVEAGTGTVKVTNARPSGTYNIQVKAYNGFATTVQNISLTVTDGACSQGLFTTFSPISASGTAQVIAFLDYNSDGKQDLAYISDGYLKIFTGNGAGGLTLVANSTTSTFYSARGICVADFNGDGKPDIATANSYSSYNSVSIRLGDGAGNFYGTTDLSVGLNPYAIATSDFNKDGNADFVTANYGSNTLTVRLGDGLGGFTSLADVVVGTNPSSVVIADFNNDGNPDLAASNYVNNTVSVRLGNGAGGFTATSQFNVGSNPYSITSGDFNGDGKQDLAVANFSSNNVSVRLGNGAGAFSGTIDIPAGSYPTFITSGDMNGDGKSDLLCSAYFGSSVTLMTGTGNGNFTATNTNVASGAVVLAIGDLNADGKSDFAIAHTYISSPTIALGTGKEIELGGNNNPILDGSTTPAATNHTDFGNVATGSSLVRTFTIQNTGTGTLTINDITVTGADSALFIRAGITVPTTIAAATSKTFTVSFSATSAGLKNAVINISNDDCDEGVYDFAIKGGTAQPGAALQFDGLDDYISVNTTAGNIDTGRTTISAWIKTSSTTASTILSKRNVCGAGNFFDFGITATGKLSIEFDNNGTANQGLTGVKIVNDGLWHQVAIVRQDSVLTLYVDGILDTTYTSAGIAAVNNNAPLLIGASACNGAGHFFKGEIDDLRFWGRVLSQPSLQNGLNCELASTQTGLIAYYKFNQGMAQDNNTAIITLTDASGNANAGTLYNFSLTGSQSNWTSLGGVPTGVSCSNINVWRGITADWSVANNWSLGIVPFDESTVVINLGVPFMPEITDPASVCFSLNLKNGATITIKSTGRLNILGRN